MNIPVSTVKKTKTGSIKAGTIENFSIIIPKPMKARNGLIEAAKERLNNIFLSSIKKVLFSFLILFGCKTNKNPEARRPESAAARKNSEIFFGLSIH